MFESNILSNLINVDEIIELFLEKGYDLIFRNNTDTKLKLNLNKLKHKSLFTNALKNYYIMDYPPNYDIKHLPHENTLEGAEAYCVKNNCSGVTLQYGIYQVRNGKYIEYYKDDSLRSWIYL